MFASQLSGGTVDTVIGLLSALVVGVAKIAFDMGQVRQMVKDHGRRIADVESHQEKHDAWHWGRETGVQDALTKERRIV